MNFQTLQDSSAFQGLLLPSPRGSPGCMYDCSVHIAEPLTVTRGLQVLLCNAIVCGIPTVPACFEFHEVEAFSSDVHES
jgi:hypothetical protein